MSNDPHEVLGLDRSADAAAVRRRYLELVRQFTPEQAPERFVQIRNAYEQLRDPVQRMQTLLFDVKNDDSLDDMLAEVRKSVRSRRMPNRSLFAMAVPR